MMLETSKTHTSKFPNYAVSRNSVKDDAPKTYQSSQPESVESAQLLTTWQEQKR
jgi:hypothetical protein